MIILGIDPGLAHTGWGVVETRGAMCRARAYGCVTTKASEPIDQRLGKIFSEVSRAIETMGYDLSEEDITKVYDAFCQLTARKGAISTTELDAIIASEALQVPQTFKLESFVINSGNTIMATSHMRLRRDDEVLDSVALGDGPVDASFLAIEQIVGHHYELDDFKIRAVTEGREALGETVIRLRADDGRVYSGRGLSTDVIGSSILAYISAVNKVVYEEAGE